MAILSTRLGSIPPPDLIISTATSAYIASASLSMSIDGVAGAGVGGLGGAIGGVYGCAGGWYCCGGA